MDVDYVVRLGRKRTVVFRLRPGRVLVDVRCRGAAGQLSVAQRGNEMFDGNFRIRSRLGKRAVAVAAEIDAEFFENLPVALVGVDDLAQGGLGVKFQRVHSFNFNLVAQSRRCDFMRLAAAAKGRLIVVSRARPSCWRCNVGCSPNLELQACFLNYLFFLGGARHYIFYEFDDLFIVVW